MPTLELIDLEGGYGDTQVLRGVNIHVDRGEIVVIIGPNGAGKSTAIKSVFGLLNITGGEIRLDGEILTNTPPEKVVRKGVCYVPQTANIFPSLTVEENLEMGAYVREGDFQPRLAEVMDLFPPLLEKRNQTAGTLSGGQRQMVAMGKALMLEPRILLLDEPTAGLSPKFRGEIFSIVKTIHATGTPILIVEQNAKQALSIADRGYVMVDGRTVHTGSGMELLEDPKVGEMFLGGGVSNGDAEAASATPGHIPAQEGSAAP